MTYEPLPQDGTYHRALASMMGFDDDGRIAMGAFEPKERDKGELSGYDGSMISAEDACDHYTKIKKGAPPAGTATISVAKVRSLEPLDAFSSPTVRNPCHAHIDFNSAQEDQWRELARQLALNATVEYRTPKSSPDDN